ncbi:lactadherin-like [Amphiura filiformis]|uniref:lactadherin-like n=1 Tax=Amphiura filiformis TaxID=82378 RepID=UPI003B223598
MERSQLGIAIFLILTAFANMILAPGVLASTCQTELDIDDSTKIPDGNFQASSVRPDSGPWSPHRARINADKCWQPDYDQAGPHWITVDLGVVMWVSGIKTRGFSTNGSPTSGGWITEYKIVGGQHNGSPAGFLVSQASTTSQFVGNVESQTLVTKMFSSPVATQYISVEVVTYNNRCCFKFELLGCPDDDECALPADNNCDTNAACTNTPGSFTCACNTGYSGDGVTCTGKYNFVP